MALSAAEKELIYDLFDIRSMLSIDSVDQYNKTILDDKINAITADQETRIKAILTKYSEIEFDTEKLQVEGVEYDPTEHKLALKKKLANALRFNIDNSGAARVI